MANPRGERPRSPDWVGGGRKVPWTWVREKLTSERNYWVSSVRQDGRPHARPVWGAFVDDLLYLSIGEAGFRASDDAKEVTVHVDSARDVVIIEGIAERVTPDPRVNDAYNAKYGYDDASFVNFVVRPSVVFAWRDEDVRTATRFR